MTSRYVLGDQCLLQSGQKPAFDLNLFYYLVYGEIVLLW